MITDQESLSTFEWTIENFTCWNSDIHGNVITSPMSINFTGFGMRLYPRGLNGVGDRIGFSFLGGERWVFFGDLSYIGPDGSVIWGQEVDFVEEVNVLELPPGPEFNEVSTRIRENEAVHKDRLILRFRMMCGRSYVEYMNTTIKVFEVSFKMHRDTLDNLEAPSNTRLFRIDYPHEGKGFYLTACKDRIGSTTKILLRLKPNVEDMTFVRTGMFMLSDNNELVKSEITEHVFRDVSEWTFSLTLTEKELIDIREGQTSLILNLKVTPKSSYKHSVQILRLPGIKIEVLPSNNFLSSIKSLPTDTSI